jgi:hypothetical protein
VHAGCPFGYDPDADPEDLVFGGTGDCGGNDLAGIFMSTAQAEKARRALRRKTDWPYLPTPEPPWFGCPHD